MQEIQVAGDYVFWDHLSVTATPLDGGEPVRRSGPVLSVFRREPDGHWVLYRDANLLAVQP